MRYLWERLALWEVSMVGFVKIEGWSAPRMVNHTGNGGIRIQVKSLCKECSACKGRVEEVKRNISNLPAVLASWETDESVVDVWFLTEDRKNPLEPTLERLALVLGAPVKRGRWVTDD